MSSFCDVESVEAPPLGLGLAALGRPGYIHLGHDGDFPAKDVDAMRAQAFATLDAAYDAGVRYFDARARTDCRKISSANGSAVARTSPRTR